ncbi:unnamed protein product [Brachionus calyciflorus]|uniref:Uncharacterized protein n=1 Tax=Brachionus calyciflorus TaxID=104777 RepID=A0A813ULH8_9BILA|nr:unnamed protein product [Brachionus calyciflorus]
MSKYINKIKKILKLNQSKLSKSSSASLKKRSSINIQLINTFARPVKLGHFSHSKITTNNSSYTKLKNSSEESSYDLESSMNSSNVTGILEMDSILDVNANHEQLVLPKAFGNPIYESLTDINYI